MTSQIKVWKVVGDLQGSGENKVTAWITWLVILKFMDSVWVDCLFILPNGFNQKNISGWVGFLFSCIWKGKHISFGLLGLSLASQGISYRSSRNCLDTHVCWVKDPVSGFLQQFHPWTLNRRTFPILRYKTDWKLMETAVWILYLFLQIQHGLKHCCLIRARIFWKMWQMFRKIRDLWEEGLFLYFIHSGRNEESRWSRKPPNTTLMIRPTKTHFSVNVKLCHRFAYTSLA